MENKKIYVTDGDTIILEDNTMYEHICCQCGLSHVWEVRRLSPGHKTMIKIKRSEIQTDKERTAAKN